MKRRFPDYMNYAVSLGLTTVVDHACCDWLGAHLTAADRPNMAIADYFWRAGKWPLRLRFQYDHRDTRDQSNIRSAAARIANSTQGLGDDMYKAVRFGEQVIAGSATDPGGGRRISAHRRRGMGAVATHDSRSRRSNATFEDHGAGGRQDSGQLATLDARARVRDHAAADRAVEEDRRRSSRAGSRLHSQPVFRVEGWAAVSHAARERYQDGRGVGLRCRRCAESMARHLFHGDGQGRWRRSFCFPASRSGAKTRYGSTPPRTPGSTSKRTRWAR